MNRWVLCDSNIELTNQLQKDLNIHPVLCHLLIHRGVTTYQEAKDFFRPSLDNLIDPFLMRGMSEAVSRINTAIENHEKILIYGDYDVDGTTAVSLAYTFFRKLTDKIDYYIPDRYDEGYGLSETGVKYAKDNDYTLIITLDCGITAVDEVEAAKQMGVDIIIGDHHLPSSKLPDAVACLDPKQSECPYPYKELSGCGIGFKICQAYAQRYGTVPMEEVYDLLDYVVISIASDIVPITGENRILAYYGLKKINENPRPGIKVIFDLLEFDRTVTITDLVFTIGPRINAAGRMKHASLAVDMLIDKGSLQLDEKARHLNQNNLARRDIDKTITENALDMIEESEELQNNYSTVLYDESWHKGVIGIVASRLIESYYRPTIVLTKSNGVLTGSARSVKGFSIYDALHECSDLLETFGGHKYAAGLSLLEENLDAFRKKFEAVVRESIEEDCLTPEIKIDAEISLNELNPKFHNIVRQFAPFGPGNMKPVFMVRNLVDAGRSKRLNNNHLKVNVRHPKLNYFYDGIGFNMGDKYDLVKSSIFDACFTIEENFFNGKTTLQMRFKDIEPSKENH